MQIHLYKRGQKTQLHKVQIVLPHKRSKTSTTKHILRLKWTLSRTVVTDCSDNESGNELCKYSNTKKLKTQSESVWSVGQVYIELELKCFFSQLDDEQADKFICPLN